MMPTVSRLMIMDVMYVNKLPPSPDDEDSTLTDAATITNVLIMDSLLGDNSAIHSLTRMHGRRTVKTRRRVYRLQ